MKKGMSRTVQFTGEVYNSAGHSGRPGKFRSDNSSRHPYLHPNFWNHARNRFWESEVHTQTSKDYFNSVHPITSQ